MVAIKRVQKSKQVLHVSCPFAKLSLSNRFFAAKYVSTEKLRKLANEILLFPSVCFTITQLHSNSFIHNSSALDIRCVIDYLMESELKRCGEALLSISNTYHIVTRMALSKRSK